MSFKLQPALETIDLSRGGASAPTGAIKLVTVPLPKNHVAVVFGQRPDNSRYPLRFNTYILDNNNIVQTDKVQVVWDALATKERFSISSTQPKTVVGDANVFSYGPFAIDYKIAVYCSNKKPGKDNYEPSDPNHSFYEFKVDKRTAIAMTMVNAEDGGDSDYFDTVVGIAVSTLVKGSV